MDTHWTIGKVAQKTGLSPKTIRYYEEISLLPLRPRTESGYRLYEEADVKRLLFIRRAKELGISLRRISAILAPGGGNSCAMTRPALKTALTEQVQELNAQIALLDDLRGQLNRELSELGRRPYSNHNEGYCNCLGEISKLISINPVE